MNTNEQLAHDPLRQIETKAGRPAITPPQRRAAPAGDTVDLNSLADTLEAGNRVIAAVASRAAQPAPRISEIRGRVDEIRGRRVEQLRQTDEQARRETRAGRPDVLRSQQMQRLNREIDEAGDAENARLRAEVAELQRKLRRPVNPNGIGSGTAPDMRATAKALHTKAQNHYLRTGETVYKGRSISEYEALAGAPNAKAMHEGSNPAGGFFILPENDMTIEKMLSQVVPMRQHARVVNINAATWAKRVRTSTGGARWGNELSSGGATNTPSYALINLPAHNLYAEPSVSGDLLADSAYDVEGEIMDGCIEDFSMSESQAWVFGTGVEQPSGFLGYAAATYTPWSTTLGHGKIGYNITGFDGGFAASGSADPVIKLASNLKQIYRQNAKYMMNRITLGACRTLKDGSGKYVWVDGDITRGIPSTLAGYPVVEAEQMPDITTVSAYAIAFADWSRFYTIVDRNGMNVLRDPYSLYPSVAFKTNKRVGGGVVNFEAGALMRSSAT